MHEHRREVLRAASVALQGRAVTLWEVSSRAEVIPVMTSAASAQSPDTRLDLDSTLHRSEEHTSELQSQSNLVCRLLLEKKKNTERRPATALPNPRGHGQSVLLRLV